MNKDQCIELDSNLTHNNNSPSEQPFDNSIRRKSSHIVMMEGTQKVGHYLTSVGTKIKSSYNSATSSASRNHQNIDNNQAESGSTYEKVLVFFACLFVIITFPITIWSCIVVVYEYQRIVMFRLGRLCNKDALGSGVYFVLPFVYDYRIVDMRTVAFNVHSQEILSKDSVTVHVDAVVYYKVNNAMVAVTNVINFSESTRLLAATTLRTVLGTKNLSEILSDRETIRHQIEVALDHITEEWGIKVDRVELKDACLPVSMQRAMAAEAESTREAKAKVISAEGERQASKSMRLAADEMAMAPQAIQLRYLQTLHTIAAEKNSTIIFPLPIELFGGFQAMKMIEAAAAAAQANRSTGTGPTTQVPVEMGSNSIQLQRNHDQAIIEMTTEDASTPGSSRGSN